MIWDVTIAQSRLMAEEGTAYFDPELSYEITHYRPITATKGLDFDPDPFTEVGRQQFISKRYNASVPPNSKANRDWWLEQHRLSKEGMEHNGYRITGDNYFFLNFYVMLTSGGMTKAGGGRQTTHPDFWAAHYEHFHYIEMCEILGYDAVLLKSRGIGASEIAASLGVRPYTTTPNFSSLYVAYYEPFLANEKGILSKCWKQLNWLNENTDGGMRRVRMGKDTMFTKVASTVNREGIESGHLSKIDGQTVDKTNKLRGDRVDRVFFEESGSNKILADTWIVAEALVVINGKRHGIRIAFGTGGDEGPDLDSLERMFLNPKTYSVLPYLNRHSPKKEERLTGYFIPAWVTVMHAMDKRGVVNEEQAKAYYDKERAKKQGDHNAYVKYCAEYCYYPEEALSRQGNNNFDQEKLADQYIEVVFHKTTPPVKRGYTKWDYEKDDKGRAVNKISGVKFIEHPTGNTFIVEEPELDETGKVIRDLYVAGIDAIDKGTGDSMTDNGSQFCITIKKRSYGLSGDKYVAFYMDRPFDVREAFEKAAQLLIMYGCKANLEDTKITIVGHFREKGWEHLLMRRPQYAIQGDARKPPNAIGTQATDKMLQHGIDLIENHVRDYCQNIYFLEMITQLQNWSWEKKGKFDIVSAMIMCEIGDEELMGIVPKKEKIEDDQWRDVGYYTDEHGIKRYGVIPGKTKLQEDLTNAAINGYNDFYRGN